MNIADFDALNRRLEEAGEKTYLIRATRCRLIAPARPGADRLPPLNLLVYQIIAFEESALSGAERSRRAPTTQWETLTYLRSLASLSPKTPAIIPRWILL